ncbi:hypothetical protein V5O48_012922 [Marasmius crinis-equi]|uniref:Uncharacterized protein n=1 Tax=Marasmius crinis-equi TaxID=585013 RepID=A0ABR3F1G7_9AGAR
MSSSAKDRRKSSRQTTLSTGNTKKSKAKGTIVVQNPNPPAPSPAKDGDSEEEVKREDSPIIWFRPTPTPVTDTAQYGWQHPAELEYLTPTDWTDTQIIHHLIAHSFDIPPRKAKGSPFFEVTGINGSRTVLPSGYRIPLMFIARFQWLSLKLVLSASDRDAEWKEYKYGILHVSRLCKKLLQVAQESLGGYDIESGDKAKVKGMDRKWRSQAFDRALARYKLKWFISEPEQLQEFWDTYKDEEYKKDPLKYDWRRWALKGHKGFSLTEDEIENGITAQQLMSGLKEKDGRWHWEEQGTATSGGKDAWELRHEARRYARSATPSSAAMAPPTPTPTPQEETQKSPSPPLSISQAKPTSSASSGNASQRKPPKAKHVAAPAGKTRGKRPGSPLEKVGAAKTQKTASDASLKTATSRPVPVTHSIPESDPSPPPFSPAIPNTVPGEIKGDSPADAAARPQSQMSNGKGSTTPVPRSTTSAPSAGTRKVGQAPEPGASRLGPSQSSASTNSAASPKVSQPVPVTVVRPGPIQTPTVSPISPRASNGKSTSVLSPSPSSPPQPTPKVGIPPAQSQTANKSATATDGNSHAATGTMNMLGLNLRSFPNASSPTTTPASSVSTNNAVIPAKPSSPALTKSGTAPSLNSNPNQEVMLRAVESLFGGFTDSTKKFSSELKSLKEEGVREVKDALREIIREEIRTAVRGVVEGASRGNQPADLDVTAQGAVASTLRNDLGALGAMVGQEVGKVVRPLRSELAGMLDDIRSSRQREEALLAAVKEMRNEMRRLEPGSGSNIAVPLTSSPPRSVGGSQLSFSTGHPLAHLLGSPEPETTSPTPQADPLTASGMHDDDNDSLFYPPTPQEQVQAAPSGPAEGVDRSASGTPMSMSSDIMLIEPELTEVKYRPALPELETAVTHFPPTPSSPFTIDEIEDVKPVLIDGRAFLPNVNGEELTPLSAFVPRRFRKGG